MSTSASSASSRRRRPPPPPPPRSRPDRIPVGPGKVPAALEAERARRRALRWRQVRTKASEAARLARSRVADRRRRALDTLAAEELVKYRADRLVELQALEEEYQKALADIGVGIEEAERDRLEQEAARQAAAAAEAVTTRRRGLHALRKERGRRELEQKLQQSQKEARQSALLAERVATAEVLRVAREKKAEMEKIELVEVDAERSEQPAKRKVTLVDRRYMAKAAIGQAAVRRIPLSDVGNTGVEAAIREQEAQRTAERALKKSEVPGRMEAERRRAQATVDARVPEDWDEEDEWSRPLSTIAEETEPPTFSSGVRSGGVGGRRVRNGRELYSQHRRPQIDQEIDDVDLVPVRGPTSSSGEDGSSPGEITSHLLLDPMAPAYTTPMAAPRDRLDAHDLENIRHKPNDDDFIMLLTMSGIIMTAMTPMEMIMMTTLKLC